MAIMMNSSINETGACKCITDGYHDIGIDAVYRDELQKKLFLVQGKWRNDGNGGVTQEEINSFVEGVKRVINLDFAGVNSKLASAVSDMSLAVKSMEYQIHTIFCHTGNQQMNEYCMRPVNELLRNVNDGINEILIFSDIRQSDIFNYFASGQDANNIDIDDVVLTSWGMVEEPRRAYNGTLPAAALGEWYNAYGNRLFAKNIRYYKGSTEVNSGMRNTLETEPENFFYYNNGIKLLCRRIVRKPAYSTTTKTGVFALEGVSLINGAQTTGTIGTAYKEIPDNVGRAFVMIQLIDLSDATDEYATMITKLSNTQNRIESRDFAALDPEQERIKTDLMFP